MRPLHLIMPMAGEGRRFTNAGWHTPKPLIELRGVPLFMRAVRSVFIEGAQMKYSLIVRKDHIDHDQIDERIRQQLPDANILSVKNTTRGAVETCLIAEQSIGEDDAILVMDCDLEFRSRSFLEGVKQALELPAEDAKGGILVSFESDDPRYSYAEVDANMVVRQTAEKEVISHHALCGAYFFSSARSFLKAAHRLLEDPTLTKSEFYVSLLFNYLIADGETITLTTMEEYNSYGTPEELSRYL